MQTKLLYPVAIVKKLKIENLIQHQSPDLANMYNKTKLLANNQIRHEPTADQTIVIGFACQEYNQENKALTTNLLPLAYVISQELMQQVQRLHLDSNSPLGKLLGPDAKALVVVSYLKQQTKHRLSQQVLKIERIVLSAQHTKCDLEHFRFLLKTEIVLPVCQKYQLTCPEQENLFLNHAGEFNSGGFKADTGLTGRKIVVDSYGPMVRVGGGCFSGKDPSKIDRSGAYMARYIAKHLV